MDDVNFCVVLNKEFFNFDKDIYINHVYIVPEISLYFRDGIFNVLQQDIAAIPADCEILVYGDMNAHTNTSLHYVIHDTYGNDVEFGNSLRDIIIWFVSAFTGMHMVGLSSRIYVDPRPLNNNGSDVINPCKVTGLLISNGRAGDDKGISRYTRIDVDGKRSGVVYYVLGIPLIFRRSHATWTWQRGGWDLPTQMCVFWGLTKWLGVTRVPRITEIECTEMTENEYKVLHLPDCFWCCPTCTIENEENKPWQKKIVR